MLLPIIRPFRSLNNYFFFYKRYVYGCWFLHLTCVGLFAIYSVVDNISYNIYSAFYALKSPYFCLKVLDGDTILVRPTFYLPLKIFSNNSIAHQKVRLAFLDAPEREQQSFDHLPIGRMATDRLKNLLEEKNILLQISGRDIYNRIVARIWIDDLDINHLMIAEGWALLYPFQQFPSVSNKNKYLKSYHQAKWSRLGIWKSRGFLSPYQFRKLGRNSHL